MKFVVENESQRMIFEFCIRPNLGTEIFRTQATERSAVPLSRRKDVRWLKHWQDCVVEVGRPCGIVDRPPTVTCFILCTKKRLAVYGPQADFFHRLALAGHTYEDVFEKPREQLLAAAARVVTRYPRDMLRELRWMTYFMRVDADPTKPRWYRTSIPSQLLS